MLDAINTVTPERIEGSVCAISGLLVEVAGITPWLSVGSRCRAATRHGQGNAKDILLEVVGFKDDRALTMPFADITGIGPGSKVVLVPTETSVAPTEAWLGRVVNALGEPIDDKGPLPRGTVAIPVKNEAPPANRRQRVAGKLDTGVRALNTFLTCCNGQRMGVFAGSGVGKSILMSMLARYSTADVNVIGLVGERGREVQEFIEDDLGHEGLARTVLVVATSNESALMRRQAAYMTMSVAEYFRDSGKQVLCMMDSVTRFAMAQREIGLAAGEPPTSKGYTPSVFAELPRLLERAGPGEVGKGNITALLSVLVEGGDTDEPVADAVRGILDGHIVLDRSIAERGRYPAINLLRSISRTMPDCNSEQENELVITARRLLSTYEDMAEMIRLGAYRRGSDPEVDMAIHYYPQLEAFISQKMDERSSLQDGYAQLAEILSPANAGPPAA